MARTRAGWTGVRIAALVAGVVLIIVAVVVVTGGSRGGGGGGCDASTTVRGLIGSEKEAYFDDHRVTDRLACLGYAVDVDAGGSRDMLDRLRAGGYSFAFPSSTPAAQKIMTSLGVTEWIPLFSTPMVVATFRPIVEVLTTAGAVEKATDGSDVVDIAALLDLATRGTTWDELPGNTTYPVRKTVLLSTTDPQDSNSAIMYLSIASQVANGGAIVTDQAQVDAVLPALCRLVFDQGGKPETSQVLFENYLVEGMGRTPMGLVYEAQYITRTPDLTDDNVMLFPRPTVYSRHTLIPFDQHGGAVGAALRDDPELVALAVEHGFRPEKPPAGQQVGERRRPVDVVESPSYEVLETMLSALAPTAENGERCARR